MTETQKEILAEVNNALGAKALMMGNDPSLVVRYLRTGVIPIDIIFQGGLPRGRWVEIYGDYSTLKSFIGYTALATAQASKKKVALIDTEHAYDPEWFEQLGGDPKKLYLQQPDYGEKAIMAIEWCLRNKYDLIVWDSIASTVPKDEYKKSPDVAIQPAQTSGDDVYGSSASERRYEAHSSLVLEPDTDQRRYDIRVFRNRSRWKSSPVLLQLPAFASEGRQDSGGSQRMGRHGNRENETDHGDEDQSDFGEIQVVTSAS